MATSDDQPPAHEEPQEPRRKESRTKSFLRWLLSRVDPKISLAITVTAGISISAAVVVPSLLREDRGATATGGSSGQVSSTASASARASASAVPGGPAISGPDAGGPNSQGTGTDAGVAEGRRVGAVLSASRTNYTGTCPPPAEAISFSARLTVSGGSTAIQYRWARSDGAVTEPATATIESGQPRTVSTSWLPREKFSGWLELRVIGPVAVTSNRVAFSVTCQVGVTASASVSPSSASGDCSTVFTMSGEVGVTDGPATVTYRWISNSNPDGPVETINFGNRGRQTQTVSSVIQPLRSGTFWVAIEILSPVSKESNHAEYTLNC